MFIAAINIQQPVIYFGTKHLIGGGLEMPSVLKNGTGLKGKHRARLIDNWTRMKKSQQQLLLMAIEVTRQHGNGKQLRWHHLYDEAKRRKLSATLQTPTGLRQALSSAKTVLLDGVKIAAEKRPGIIRFLETEHLVPYGSGWPDFPQLTQEAWHRLNRQEQLILKSIFQTLPTHRAKKSFKVTPFIAQAHKAAKLPIGLPRFSQLFTQLTRRFSITKKKMALHAIVDEGRRPYSVDSGLWSQLTEQQKQILLLLEQFQKDAARRLKGPLFQKAARLLVCDELGMTRGVFKTLLSRIKTTAKQIGSKAPVNVNSLSNSPQNKPSNTRRGAKSASTRWKRKQA